MGTWHRARPLMAGLSPPWAEDAFDLGWEPTLGWRGCLVLLGNVSVGAGDPWALRSGLSPSVGPTDVHILTPSSCECHHMWQKGLFR